MLWWEKSWTISSPCAFFYNSHKLRSPWAFYQPKSEICDTLLGEPKVYFLWQTWDFVPTGLTHQKILLQECTVEELTLFRGFSDAPGSIYRSILSSCSYCWKIFTTGASYWTTGTLCNGSRLSAFVQISALFQIYITDMSRHLHHLTNCHLK